MRRLSIHALLVLLAGACSAPPMADHPPASAMADATVEAPSSARGLDFAQAHCSGCHAVTALSISPHPEAPPFDSVVNTRGLTDATLKAWLRNSHNFPEIMNFDVDPGHIDDLAAYMLTLRESN